MAKFKPGYGPVVVEPPWANRPPRYATIAHPISDEDIDREGAAIKDMRREFQLLYAKKEAIESQVKAINHHLTALRVQIELKESQLKQRMSSRNLRIRY